MDTTTPTTTTTPLPPAQAQGVAHTTAAPAAVWALLADRPGWPSWSSLGRYEHVRGTEGELGSVCCFVTGPIRSVEELVELVPGERLTYALLSGLPLRDYRGVVELHPDADGTRITWTSHFTARRSTGWFWRRFMRRIVRDMARDLARHAA